MELGALRFWFRSPAPTLATPPRLPVPRAGHAVSIYDPIALPRLVAARVPLSLALWYHTSGRTLRHHSSQQAQQVLRIRRMVADAGV
jgi:hypothetical protein